LGDNQEDNDSLGRKFFFKKKVPVDGTAALKHGRNTGMLKKKRKFGDSIAVNKTVQRKTSSL